MAGVVKDITGNDITCNESSHWQVLSKISQVMISQVKMSQVMISPVMSPVSGGCC